MQWLATCSRSCIFVFRLDRLLKARAGRQWRQWGEWRDTYRSNKGHRSYTLKGRGEISIYTCLALVISCSVAPVTFSLEFGFSFPFGLDNFVLFFQRFLRNFAKFQGDRGDPRLICSDCILAFS